MIALRPYVEPAAAHAQASSYVYIEPGTFVIRAPDGRSQQIGKVIVDLTNGNVWGFPTLQDAPYPRDNLATKPPVSKPMLLGKYDFSEMRR
jgi:hypothetical protein